MDLRTVRTYVLVTFGLVLLALSQHRGGIHFPTLSHENKTSLRCDEVIRLAEWSMNRHGGKEAAPITHQKTIERAVQIFAEKADPYKILFTADEVEDFKRGAIGQWASLLKSHSCGYFSAWLESSSPSARLRLKQTVSKAAFVAPKNFDTKKAAMAAKPKSWATGDAELKKRVEAMGNEILRSAPAAVLKAYEGKLPLLVLNTMEESVLPESQTASSLLAKSILGTFDPYTTYLSKEEFDDFYSELSGGASGLGIRVRKVPAGLLIEDIIENSSASKSGKLHKNDVIVKVEGQDAKHLSMIDVKHLLKGPEDSKIRLAVTREKQAEEDIQLTRKHFDYEEAKISVRKDAATPDVAVIAIPNFYGSVGFDAEGNLAKSSAEDLRTILEELEASTKKPSALVLDLRGNPGGFLEEAVTMASFFIGSKPVVGVVEKDSTKVLKEEMAEPLYSGKLVVLVDSGTASAAEVLAGALRDLHRAVLVGSSHTYGKGSVQKLFSLDEDVMELGLVQPKGNGVLKLTTSIFYSPMGHTPANGGVKTDITLPDKLLASQEEYGTAPSMEVTDHPPFLDDATILDLQLKQNLRQGLLRSLQELSTSRLTEQKAAVSDDLAVREASHIAMDLLKSQNNAL